MSAENNIQSKRRSKKAPKVNPANVETISESTAPSETVVAPKQKVGLTLNWNRAIYINKPIDDALVKELTPLILKLKQESTDPITVGIDSPGGNLGAMESILSLLNCPDQDGKSVEIYTVATNKAYSAAASFLAFGDYSVVFPHSNILYHDVRYTDLDDVTPSKALETARQLERSNTTFALKLAHRVQRRWIWIYLGLQPHFGQVRDRWKDYVARYDQAFKDTFPTGQQQIVDVVAFAMALYSRLSSPNDRQIAIRALELLASWMQIERVEQNFSIQAGSITPSVQDPANEVINLVDVIKRMDLRQPAGPTGPEATSSAVIDQSVRDDIRLLLEVLARRLAEDKNQNIGNDWLDKIIEDFSFMKDIRDPNHFKTTTRMMIDHAGVFFDQEIANKINAARDNFEDQNKILSPFYPQARLFWYYIVLVCRCLCRGDHFLTPYDAQLLGLVDQVLGGGMIQSKREWRKSQPNYE